MKRIYKIPKVFSFTFGKLTIGLWKWTNQLYWKHYLSSTNYSRLFTSWQFGYFKCTVYKKIEIQWLYHFYFQIIIDK